MQTIQPKPRRTSPPMQALFWRGMHDSFSLTPLPTIGKDALILLHPRKWRRRRQATLPGFLAASLATISLPVSHARAQAIEQYFPAIGTAAGEQAIDPAQVPVSRGYAPLGLKLGTFDFALDGSEGIGYNSNVDRLPTGHASTEIETQGHLGVTAKPDSLDQLHGDIQVDDLRFPSRSFQNRTTWNGNMGATHDFGHDTLGITYSHLSLVQMPTDSGALTLTAPVFYTVDQTALSYTVMTHGRFSFVPQASYMRYDFANSANSVDTTDPTSGTSSTIAQSYRNRSIYTEGVLTNYELMTNSKAVLLLQGTEIRYDHDEAGFPIRNSNGLIVMAGYDFGLSGPIQFRALAGYQIRQYASSLYGKITSPIGDIELGWMPDRLTGVKFQLHNGIEDGAFENVVGYTNLTMNATVTHAWQRNIMLSAYGSFTKSVYPQTPVALEGTPVYQMANKQKSYAFGATANYLVNRHLTISAQYEFSKLTTIGSGLFPVHLFLVSCRFAL